MIHEKKPAGHSLTPEPVLYCCRLDENLEPGIRFGPVIRDVFIIECCTAGYGSVIINGREFPVTPGDCYILLPGDTVIHTADRIEPRSGVWCALNGLHLGAQFARAGITAQTPFAPAEVFGEITDRLMQMYEMENDSDPGAEMRRTGMIYEVLGALMRTAPPQRKENLCIRRALGLMETHYDKDLTVAHLAAEVGLERSYFSTLFREETGQTPHAYLCALRIRKACTLLRAPGCSIGEAADSVGIGAQNFARLFKREMGITPREFLRQISPPSR